MYFFTAWNKDGVLETEQWVDTLREVHTKTVRYEADKCHVSFDWMNDDNRLVRMYSTPEDRRYK